VDSSYKKYIACSIHQKPAWEEEDFHTLQKIIDCREKRLLCLIVLEFIAYSAQPITANEKGFASAQSKPFFAGIR
jgi:hypothetical protein